jgi:hypothetical protein
MKRFLCITMTAIALFLATTTVSVADGSTPCAPACCCAADTATPSAAAPPAAAPSKGPVRTVASAAIRIATLGRLGGR